MCECCRYQAEHMAKIAKIELLPEEKEAYVQDRHIMPTGEKGEKLPSLCCRTDPEVLFDCFEEARKAALIIEEQKATLIEEQQTALIKIFPFLLVRKFNRVL